MESPRFRPAFTPTLLLPLALVLTGPLTQAQAAGLQTFTDKAEFLAATGATSATGPLPDLGYIASGSVTLWARSR
jgi:hypothetical protein